ncbi:MAG: ABC transporter ATP-binding protein [Pirellulaceae bacterium]|nr:ABC transporter ATP-binding protein [Pirellulaceae bacterium]
MTQAVPVITLQQLTVQFPGCTALAGVDLQIRPGTVFALLGENGAGKTTLIRVLTGFQMPSTGGCQVLGLDPTHQAQEIRRRVGYVSDAPALYEWMVVAEIGWFASAFYPEGFFERYRAAIAHYEVPADRKIKYLSKGQRAKVALALALAHDPELLILDEPTSGLDPLVRREFLESMLDRVAVGKTVLLSSHQIAEVERVADTVAILHRGRFRAMGELNHLRESVHEVLVSLDDPLISLPLISDPAIVLGDTLVGRQRRLIVQNYSESVGELLRGGTGVVSVHSRGATLEELFAACIRGNGQIEAMRSGLAGQCAASDVA